jgi:hypothetical protein
MTGTPVTIPAGMLRDMLAAVLPHVGTEESLPQLEAVRFEVTAGVLYLVATDRYSTGIARYRIPGAQVAPPADQAALLWHPHAQELREKLAAHADARAVALILSDATVTVDHGETDSWKVADEAGHYPEWRPMLRKLLTAEPVADAGEYAVDTRLFARFDTSTTPFDPYGQCPEDVGHVRIVHPEAVALLVTRSDWFIGAAMSCHRNPDTVGFTPPQWADWTALCAPVAAGPEPAAAAT